MMINVARKGLTDHERCLLGRVALSHEQFSGFSRGQGLRQDGLRNELRGETGEAAE